MSNNLKEKKKLNQEDRVALEDHQEEQLHLEECILKYQEATKLNDQDAINKAYKMVCKCYQPLSFIKVWYKKYYYLYETKEDFIQDYLRIFCTALSAWQPRHLRKKSRYDGTGQFKNFFWSALSHNYINMVKAEAAGKKNLSSRCPICDKWCNPLSTHLLKSHKHLLWEQLEMFGYPVEQITSCPFCKSHKALKKVSCQHPDKKCDCLKEANRQSLEEHLISMHSTYLFERFRDLYPEYTTLSSKASTVYLDDDNSEGEQVNLYDVIPDNSIVNKILAHNLTEVQRSIVQEAIVSSKQIKYKSDLYNCTSEQFDKELEGLRNIMTLCGLEG